MVREVMQRNTVLLTLPCLHSMRRRVYVTVGCSSVRLSVCPVDRQQQQRAAGLLLSAGAGCRYQSKSAGAGAQQQMRAASC